MEYKDILYEIEQAVANWNMDDVIGLQKDIDKIFNIEKERRCLCKCGCHNALAGDGLCDDCLL